MSQSSAAGGVSGGRGKEGGEGRTVEVLPRGGAVDPRLVRRARVIPDVLDVPEDMSPAVLRDEVAQICAEAHVGDGRLVRAPALDGEALEEHEAAAVEQGVAHAAEEALERRQREVGLGDGRQRRAGGEEGVGGPAELGELGVAEAVRPLLRMCGVVVGVPCGRAGDLLGEVLVGTDLVEVGRRLAARLDSVGKDLGVGVVVCKDLGWVGVDGESLGEGGCHGGEFLSRSGVGGDYIAVLLDLDSSRAK